MARPSWAKANKGATIRAFRDSGRRLPLKDRLAAAAASSVAAA